MANEPWSDLDLDRDEAPASGSLPVPETDDPAMGGGGRILGDAFDGLGGVEGPALELESVERPTARRPVTAPAAGATASHEALPAPAAISGVAGEVDEVEVDALADYGEPPASFVMWVPYAILVTSRRHQLKKDLAELRRLRAAAEQDARDALIELGRALHQSRADGLRSLASMLRPCDEAGEVATGRTQQWERLREAADAQRAALAKKIEEAERAVGPYRDRETKLATQMTTRDNELKRAKAKLSRTAIEIRSLRQAAERTGEGIDAPKLELLEAERDARQAEVDKAQGHVDELEPQLATARKELAVMLHAVNDLEAQRRAIDKAQERTEKAHLSSAGEAEDRYHTAVRELAEAALDRRLADDIEPRLARSALMMRSAVASREREIAVHERALGAYDKASFQKGWAIVAVVGLVVLTMLVLIIVR